ncbi:MAG: hypothetical protein RLZZ232_1748 [Planctomycetota bacterium]|jgi:hypothetical protein
MEMNSKITPHQSPKGTHFMDCLLVAGSAIVTLSAQGWPCRLVPARWDPDIA